MTKAVALCALVSTLHHLISSFALLLSIPHRLWYAAFRWNGTTLLASAIIRHSGGASVCPDPALTSGLIERRMFLQFVSV